MRLNRNWPWWKRALWGLVAGACLGALSILFCLVVLGLPPLAAVIIGTVGGLIGDMLYVGGRVIRARFLAGGRPDR